MCSFIHMALIKICILFLLCTEFYIKKNIDFFMFTQLEKDENEYENH